MAGAGHAAAPSDDGRIGGACALPAADTREPARGEHGRRQGATGIAGA